MYCKWKQENKVGTLFIYLYGHTFLCLPRIMITSLWLSAHCVNIYVIFQQELLIILCFKIQLPTVIFLVTMSCPLCATAHSGCRICLSIWLWHLKGRDALRWCEVPEQLASTQVWGFLMHKSQHGTTATTGKTAQCDAVRLGTGNVWRLFFTEGISQWII